MADTKISDSVIYIGADDHDIDLLRANMLCQTAFRTTLMLSLTRR